MPPCRRSLPPIGGLVQREMGYFRQARMVLGSAAFGNAGY
jgi:hypothetical protein